MFTFNRIQTLYLLQEVELLKASLFPSLACAAARRGDIDRLKLLAEAVSIGFFTDLRCEYIN